MKVCIVGSGGREHGLALVLGRTAEVVVTPGNVGIPGSTEQDPETIDADLYVIGPELPLVDGLADRLRSAGKRVFGPGADGAQIEGSKAFMKDLAQAAGVPTARFGVFDNLDEATEFLSTLDGLYVIKTDGLAAGKGVLVTDDFDEAVADARDKLEGVSFGEAGRRVIIEEGLSGAEASVFVICDGQRAVALEPSQDFKRIGDGDTGPNTGGVGAWSPFAGCPDDLAEVTVKHFVEPTLAELRSRGIDYRGVLYVGLMLTDSGPKLIEYNIRFGDPDSQVVLLRLESDLVALLAAAADGNLAILEAPQFRDEAAVLVVASSEGYPLNPRIGDVISGVEEAAAVDAAQVLFAGVAKNSNEELITAGGRVLDIVGMGPTVSEARTVAYEALSKISFEGMQNRNDIAGLAR